MIQIVNKTMFCQCFLSLCYNFSKQINRCVKGTKFFCLVSDVWTIQFNIESRPPENKALLSLYYVITHLIGMVTNPCLIICWPNTPPSTVTSGQHYWPMIDICINYTAIINFTHYPWPDNLIAGLIAFEA